MAHTLPHTLYPLCAGSFRTGTSHRLLKQSVARPPFRARTEQARATAHQNPSTSGSTWLICQEGKTPTEELASFIGAGHCGARGGIAQALAAGVPSRRGPETALTALPHPVPPAMHRVNAPKQVGAEDDSFAMHATCPRTVRRVLPIIPVYGPRATRNRCVHRSAQLHARESGS